MQKKGLELFSILKLNTSTIILENFSLNREYVKSKKSGEIISLGDNQLLKFIRQIKKIEYNKDKVRELYRKRNELKHCEGNADNSLEITKIQNQINEIVFVPDVVIVKSNTTKKDYKDICKSGFVVNSKINDKSYSIKYTRLCAGAGQLRRNSSVFVNEELFDLLEQIMMCGLNRKKIGKINLAKFGAYFSLYTSAIREVRTPRICVVDDFEYTLKNEPVSWIFQNDDGEMDIEDRNIDIVQNAFDGHGIISVEMAQKWSEDLNLDYVPASYIIRSAWTKGAVSVFDFHKFSKEVAHKDEIVDYWGDVHKIDNIDVILTKSQAKMAKKYVNFYEYMHFFNKYHHSFGVTRVSKKENDFMTTLNYQYIQSNNFTKESIKNMADYSIEYIKKIMSGDEIFARLLVMGSQKEQNDIQKIEDNIKSNIGKALLYSEDILNDSYVRNKISKMASSRINAIKIGKLYVEGSYDFAIPDLYALAEHAFGMEVKGLLQRKQCWNKRWVDKGTKVVAVARSPLVAPSENQLMNVYTNSSCDNWFRYINSGNIMNIWDTAMMRCSDADFDGDLLLTTDNEYFVGAVRDYLKPITYEKKKAKEQYVNRKSFAKVDSLSFDTKIGFITNLASNFIAMTANFSPDSKEYKELIKRTDLLRFYQGSAIDQTKGDVFIPPPKEWSRKQRFNDDMTEEERKNISFNNKICCDKKAYFFGYIYPKLLSEYRSHRRNYQKMSKLVYGLDLQSLIKKDNKNSEEKIFVRDYFRHIPLLQNDCTMNVLCDYVEKVEIENRWAKPSGSFNYHKMQSSESIVFDNDLYSKVFEVISNYKKSYNYIITNRSKSIEEDDMGVFENDIDSYNSELSMLLEDTENELLSIHNNISDITDCLVDVYYTKFSNQPKPLLWGEFGKVIVNNLRKNSNKAIFPIESQNGEEYLGKHYSIKEVDLL